MSDTKKLLSQALDNLKIKELNPMQQATLRKAVSPNDLILLSPTGSGKTLAFLLPLLEILKQGDETIQALILVPSRELALQTENVWRSMKTPWSMVSCYGGHPIADEKRSIAGTKPAIIIGTPGRVGDHIYKGNFDTSSIKTLVIDEFDKSLEFGFHDEMIDIITQLRALNKRILLSATEAEEIPEFTGLNRTTTLNYLEQNKREESRLTMKRIISPARDKIETLYRLLCTLGSDSSIVFCNHREAADRIKNLLGERDIYAESFHGGMEQPDRERALYKFRNGSCNVFVATDLAARGLDIPEVEHIIHYHLPTQEDAFTHRNGRTARWEASGVAYLILCEDEASPKFLDVEELEIATLPETTQRVPRPKWTTLYVGKGRKDKLSKMDIAGFLYKKGQLTRDDVGQIDVKEHYAFVAVRRDKVRSLMSLIRGEKIKGRSILIQEAR